MKIFLVGFMGCGKSTMGKKLAKTLECEVVDLDYEIEQVAGMPVAAYFALYGEAAFRNLETKTLKEFDYPENCVVATGGGTPCFFDNMEWMNVHGITIYIKMSPLALARRLEKGKAKRPLLKDLDEEGIVSFIAGKLLDRDPYYYQAYLITDGVDLTSEQLKEAIFSS